MISKECKITISGNTASIDSEIYLYKNDMNIKYLFNIVNSEYAYTKDSTLDNIINANKASYAQIKFKKEDIEIDFDVQETSNGKAILLIKKELIDEETELGDYTIQIRLFDESKSSVITLPPVNNCIHIMRPIFEKVDGSTNVVDEAAVDEAIVTYSESIEAIAEDGTFSKKVWSKGDKITSGELNRMEDGIAYNNSQYKDIANKQATDFTLNSSTNLLQLVSSSGEKLGKGITLPTSSVGGTSQYLHIKYSSVGAPQIQAQISDAPNTYIGLCADENVEAPLNPFSYTWYKWKGEQGNKGDKGDKGDTGATPQLAIGEVTTLDSGSNATASITGTAQNPLLNLGIPKGENGTGGSSEIWKKVIETTFEEDCYACTVTKDKDDNDLQIKEGFIFITASQPKDTSSNLSFGIGFKDWESSFNRKATIYNFALYKNYEFYRVGFYFKVINNFVFTQYLGNNRIGVSAPIYNNFNNSNISNANMTSNFRALLNNLDYIDKITVGLDMSTTGLFSKDSIMEVWAKC